MKVAIVGSRGFSGRSLIHRYVNSLPAGTIVVSGGARGVDAWAEDCAIEHGLQVISFRPAQEKMNLFYIERVERFSDASAFRAEKFEGSYPSFPAAAFARNGMIVDEADRIVAFWDGSSRGTADTIARVRKSGKPFAVVNAEGKTIEKVKPETRASYIVTTLMGSGYCAVLVWWNPEGFWEPWQTGIGRYATENEAAEEARGWALSEGLEFKPSGGADAS